MSEIFNSIEEIKEKINSKGTIKFKIKVIANSKNNSFEFLNDFIKLKIKQKPIEGKANKAIIEYLSDLLKISKSKIKIVTGEKSDIKTIQVN